MSRQETEMQNNCLEALVSIFRPLVAPYGCPALAAVAWGTALILIHVMVFLNVLTEHRLQSLPSITCALASEKILLLHAVVMIYILVCYSLKATKRFRRPWMYWVVRVNCCYGTSLGEHGTNGKKKLRRKKWIACVLFKCRKKHFRLSKIKLHTPVLISIIQYIHCKNIFWNIFFLLSNQLK